MIEITRFRFDMDGSIEPYEDGKWVRYEDMLQRTWVGLAPEDRLTAKYMQDAPDGIEAVIDYIEAKLKEKNT